MRTKTPCFLVVLALAGCNSAPSAPSQGGSVAEAPQAGSEPGRAKVTQAQCEAQGGGPVGDIGDGATHRPDYVCPSGKKPLGNIAPAEGGPVAVEGNVCCPK